MQLKYCRFKIILTHVYICTYIINKLIKLIKQHKKKTTNYISGFFNMIKCTIYMLIYLTIDKVKKSNHNFLPNFF